MNSVWNAVASGPLLAILVAVSLALANCQPTASDQATSGTPPSYHLKRSATGLEAEEAIDEAFGEAPIGARAISAFSRVAPFTDRASTERARHVDQKLVESMTPSQFLESESELFAEFVQEHGNLVSALMSHINSDDSDAEYAKLTYKVLGKLIARMEGNSGKSNSRRVSRHGADQGGQPDLRDILRILGLYTARDVSLVRKQVGQR